MKTIYFGAYTTSDLHEMGITGFNFEGNVYEYKMEVHPADGFIRITDSCKRMIPIDKTHYDQFAQALDMVQELQALADVHEELEKVVYGGKPAVGIGSNQCVEQCVGCSKG